MKPEKKYNIIFSGKIARDRKREDIEKNLIELLKIDRTKAQLFFEGNPIVLKKGVDNRAASKYIEIFNQKGLICNAVIQKKHDSEQHNPSNQSKCPKCGYDNDRDLNECLRCGIVFSKYSDKKSRCPKCGYSNDPDQKECLRCGLIFAKYKEIECKKEDQPEHPIGRPDEMDLTTCPSCDKAISKDDKFCPFCGQPVIVLSGEEKKKIQLASKAILGLSILFFVFGTILGILQLKTAGKAQMNLARYRDSDRYPEVIDGKYYTVGEVKRMVDNEVKIIFIINYFLAAVMFGLHVWSRRSPFPAMVTALCVYSALIALNAIIDPKTFAQGIIIKVLIIVILVGGLKASLVARGMPQE